MTKQAVIYFNDGENDWIDPIEDDSIQYIGNIVAIDNGWYTYQYEKELIDKIEIVEI